MKRSRHYLLGSALSVLLCPVAMAATQTFSTPGPHSFTVPTGVTSIEVEVAGAGGGAGSGVTVPDEFSVPAELVGVYPGGSGGDGARVTAQLAVAPGDVIEIVVAASGKGGTLHRNNAHPNTGAGGWGAGSGGATANSSNPNDEGAYSLNGGGGGGASSLTVSGTFIRAGGGGGGGGAHRNQSTFSHAESGSAALIPAVSTPDCASPADGLSGTSSPYAVENQAYQRTGSGGGGYLGAVGAGGVTPGLIFGAGFPIVEFAPTGGGGGGSCFITTGVRTLSAVTSDSQGGAGGAADQNPSPLGSWFPERSPLL